MENNQAQEITVHTDNKHLTFVTAMSILFDTKKALQDFELQALIHNLNTPASNALRLRLKKSYVDALSILCGIYVSDETPHVFDDSIIGIFANTYASEEYRHIIDSVIEQSNGSVFEEMLNVLHTEEMNKDK